MLAFLSHTLTRYSSQLHRKKTKIESASLQALLFSLSCHFQAAPIANQSDEDTVTPQAGHGAVEGKRKVTKRKKQ